MPLFDWTKYLSLAKDLSASSEEAVLRSAISRAYYAAFNQAKDYCVSQGIYVERSTDSHVVVWNAFLSLGRHLRGVQKNGDLLRAKRVLADYNANPIARLSDVVKQAIHESENVLSYLSSAATPPPSTPPEPPTH